MPLIVCPECGQTISDQSKACPTCGYPIQKATGAKLLEVLRSRKNILVGIFAILLIVVIAIMVSGNNMNKYEKLALKDCEALRGMLKNPNSLTLYDDIFIYPDNETFGTLVYISYGATNSYGGMVQSVAIFEEGNGYIGELNPDEDDYSSRHEYNHAVIAGIPYKLEIQIHGNYDNFIRVDANKIMKKIS